MKMRNSHNGISFTLGTQDTCEKLLHMFNSKIELKNLNSKKLITSLPQDIISGLVKISSTRVIVEK
jgi:hypothetical protein